MKKKYARTIALAITVVMLMGCIPITASADEIVPMTVAASEAQGVPGTTVEVRVSVKNNPGFTSLKFLAGYDAGVLNLKTVKINDDITANTQVSPISANPVIVNYFKGNENYSGDAVIATFSFEILDTAFEGDYSDIVITFSQDDIFDTEENAIETEVVNGKVTVISCIPGDINGDEKVNNKDLMRLFQHLSGLDVVVNEPALDTNGDGKINNKDLMRLFQHLSGLEVELFPKPVSGERCRHEMTAHEAVNATCTEDGSIAYWECTKCGKLFADAKGSKEITLAETVEKAKGHTVVIDPAVPATYTEKGLTEGSHCSVCLEVLVPQEEYGPLTPNTRSITYHIVDKAKHPYLATLEIEESLLDKSYIPGEVKTLKNLDLGEYGYTFNGWYDGFGENATQIKRIEATDTENIELFAHVTENEYDITYNLYQVPVTSTPTEKQLHYKASQGNSDLYTPEINNYIFLGWYDDNGVEYKNIPIGTTGHIKLNPYYTSLRNYAVSVEDNNPIILEDHNANVVYFTYELGEIRNIPLNGDNPFWEIQSVAGLTQQVSKTYTTTISSEEAEVVSKVISDMTVNSSTWTLSESWNDVTTVNKSWAESIGKESEQCKTEATTSSNTLSVSNQTGGSSYHKSEDGSTVYDYNSKTETKDKGHQFDANLSGKYTNKMSANLGTSNEYGTEGSFSASNAYTNEGKVNANNWSASGSQSGSQTGSSSVSDKDKYSAGISYENGFEVSAGLHYGYHNNTNTVTKTGTDTVTVNSNVDESTSSWNNSATFSATQQHSSSQAIRNTLSDVVTTTKGYGSSYSNGGTDTNSQGFCSTASNTSGTTSSLTFSKLQSETTTKTYGVDGKIEGKYRCILAGKAHVFAVVGYDYSTKSFFAYTFSVMDDRVEEFLDYTPKGGNYTDCENSCLPFEIPFFVFEYVSSKTAKTSGVNYITNSKTGTAKIVGYSGTDTDVIIPSYVSDGKQTYKVTEIGESAFSGKPVRSVVVGEFVKAIPNSAFMNCTELEEVIGSFTEIGNEAFAGCTNLINMNIPSNVVKIGTDAFRGASSVNVRAINSLSAYAQAVKELPNGNDEQIEAKQKEITQRYIDSILDCGAQNIVLDLSCITSGVELNLEVPEMASIEIDGGDRVYDRFRIDSSANETTLKYFTITGSRGTPIVTSSDKLTIQKVFLNSNTTALIMKQKGATLSLVQDSSIESSADYAVVGNNLTIESQITNDGAVGFISVDGNFGYANEITGQEYVEISNGKLKQISEEEFNNYVKGAFTVNFDPNYGSVNQSSKIVYYGNTYGELPIPHRDYYTFAGWFTDANSGDYIGAEAVVTINSDQILYAHWVPNSFTVSFNANGGVCNVGSKLITYGANLGELPIATRDYYFFTGWFLENGTQVSSDTVFDSDNNQLIYAHWSEKPVSDWTPIASVPAGSQTIETKWTYSEREETESTATALDGYNRFADYWVSSGSGTMEYSSEFPSGFYANHELYQMARDPVGAYETETNKRDVSLGWAGYIYYHWMYNVSYANTTERTISSKALSKGAYDNYAYNYFYAFKSSVDCPYLSNGYCNNQNLPSYNCVNVLPDKSSIGVGTPRFFRFSYYVANYTDYYKVFKYYRIVDKETNNAIYSGGNISNVQQWVKYREK